MITVKKGDTAVLQCEVNGDKPINVIWLRAGKHELNPSTNYRSVNLHNHQMTQPCDECDSSGLIIGCLLFSPDFVHISGSL